LSVKASKFFGFSHLLILFSFPCCCDITCPCTL
jgi:hypothetical protein